MFNYFKQREELETARNIIAQDKRMQSQFETVKSLTRSNSIIATLIVGILLWLFIQYVL